MEFRLLGSLEVLDGDAVSLGGVKQRAVLAHLLLRANRVVPAERLIAQVWGDEPPAAARNVVQTYVSRLRKSLGDERLQHRSGGYVLAAAPDEVDATRFRMLVAEARRRVTDDPASAVLLYREAEGLWRGPALDDLGEQESLRGEAAQLDELRVAAAEERIVTELALGAHAELVPELERLTALHPLRESLWGHLITALYRSGRQADALAVYRRARTVLLEQLGLEPSSDLRQLEQQVLRQDPALQVAARPLRGFRLLERIGEGAFGVVHRAEQPSVGREVAIKVVRPALADHPEYVRRFETEAQLVARLEHPYIVPLYDYWREPGGAFLVMRLMRGGSLRDVLEAGPLTLDLSVRVVQQVGTALAHAHARGVVHRDVKPGNILFDEDHNAYLSDFGVARDLSLESAPEGASARAVSGSYVSPEELRGEEPTARADVYRLGRVLAAMVPTPRRDALEDVLRQATAPDPADRYPDASAMVDALAPLVRAARAPVTPAADPGRSALRNPYKGLRAFLEPDAPDFHGRDVLIGRLLGRLDDGARPRLLALVGPSGSGKSSVVHAGLLPAVRARTRQWFVAEMTPGADPFGALAAALVAVATAPLPVDLRLRLESEPQLLPEAVAQLLPVGPSELLLVVDQLEELFTQVEDRDRRRAFLSALRAAATAHGSRIRVVLTLRADFLDRPLAHADFADVLRAGTELVLPLTVDELAQAVAGPARGSGVDVEPSLLAELVSDAVGQPGALPLLQFALAELFDRSSGGTLTLADYCDMGGIGAAVARGAEDVYGTLDAAGRGATRQLFLRLVERVDGGTWSRRRTVLRSELLSLGDDPQRMDRVIEAFAARRLLSYDRDATTRAPTVGIAHDALLGAWARLQSWLVAARDDLYAQRQLAAAARDWSEADHEPSFLLRGTRLEHLRAWSRSTELALAPAERSFLDASQAASDHELAEETSRRARERELERRSLHRLRALTGVLAAAAVVAGLLTVFAFGQRSEAERERRVAVARALASAAVASVDVDAERSILLALAAVDLTRSVDGVVLPEAEEALHRAVVASRVVLRVPEQGGALDWSPDGRLFVTEGVEESGIVDVRDAVTGASVRSFPAHEVDVNLVAFSAAGTMLATSGDDGAVNVWDPRSGVRLRRFADLGDAVWGVSFSPDGSLLAASSWAEKAVHVWEIATGRQVSVVRPISSSLTTSFSPDGRRLAIPTFDRGAVVVDVRTGSVVLELDAQEGVSDVDWSPDGRWLATSGFDSTIRLWDGRTGEPGPSLLGHRGEVVAADWSADSRRLATGARDGTAKVWEVGQGGAREVLTLSAQEKGGGLWVAFSPDGSRLMTGDQGITAVKVWDVSDAGSAEWANVPAAPGGTGRVAFGPDGNELVTATGDGALSVWDVVSGRQRAPLGPMAPAPSEELVAAVSRQGTVAAAAGGAVHTWDLGTGRAGLRLPGPRRAVDLDWSSDGSRLAVAGAEAVQVLDRAGRTLARLASAPGQRVSALRLSPDSGSVAVAVVSIARPGTGSDELRIWDLRRDAVARTIRTAAEALAYSPDGTQVASAGPVGPPRIWDVRTGRAVQQLTGHTGAVNDLAFSPDGSVVATASSDGTVRLWDPLSGAVRLVLRGHEGAVSDVAFSPDGDRLVSVGSEGRARVWALDLDDLIALAEDKLTRDLTPEECRQHRHGRGC